MRAEILGVDLYHILGWFIVYSFLGWVWESCYVSAKSHRFVNRGFVSGPFVTIYGVGAVLIYVTLRPLEDKPLLLYCGGLVVATVLEYVTGALMEAIFHTSWWDYSGKRFNFRGRICLGSSLAWGAFTLLLFYVIHPPVAWLVDLVPRRAGYVAETVWIAGYVVDFGFSAAAAFHLKDRLARLDEAWDELQEDIQDSIQNLRLNEAAVQLREKAELHRKELLAGQTEFLGEWKERLRDLADRQEVAEDFKERFLERYDALTSRYTEFRDQLGRNARRHLKAYPNLSSHADRIRRLAEKRGKKEKK